MEPEFVVTISHDDEDGPADIPVDETGDAGQTRLTLRMPETLKARVETAADTAGVSVNAWLVRAVTQALSSPSGRTARPSVGKRYTGFARS
jgi:hypothetical protein